MNTVLIGKKQSPSRIIQLFRKSTVFITAAAFCINTLAQQAPTTTAPPTSNVPHITISPAQQSFKNAVAERKAITNLQEALPSDHYKALSPAIINSDDFLGSLNMILTKQDGSFTSSEIATISRGFHLSELSVMVRSAAGIPVGASIEAIEAGLAIFSAMAPASRGAVITAGGALIVGTAMLCATALTASPSDDGSKQIADACVKILGAPVMVGVGTFVLFGCAAVKCQAFKTSNSAVASHDSKETESNEAQTDDRESQSLNDDVNDENSKQTCTDEVKDRLNTRMHNICDAASRCTKNDVFNISDINRKIGALSACIAARNLVTKACFRESTPGHDEQIENKVRAIDYCKGLLSRGTGR